MLIHPFNTINMKILHLKIMHKPSIIILTQQHILIITYKHILTHHLNMANHIIRHYYDVALYVSFPTLKTMPDSEFSIKSYLCLLNDHGGLPAMTMASAINLHNLKLCFPLWSSHRNSEFPFQVLKLIKK